MIKLSRLKVSLVVAAFIAIFAGAAPIPANAQGGQAVLLRYKFKKGEVLKYSTKADTTSLGGLTGASSHAGSMAMTSATTYTVTNVDSKGNATIVIRVSSLQMNPQFPGMKGRKTSNAIGSAFKSLSNISTTQVLSPDGKILSLKVSGGPGAGMRTQNPPDGGVRQGGNLSALPDHPVHVGQTWAYDMSGTFGRMHTTMKLASVRVINGHRIARITMKTTADMSRPGGMPALQSMGTVTADGAMTFDIDRGDMIDNSNITHLNMSFNMPKQPGMPASAMHSGPIHTRVNVLSTMHLVS